MDRFIAGLDWINRAIGLTVCWLALAMVLLQFAIVILRYLFGISYIFLQEGVLYMHAALFMLGAGYALLVDEHVRVDIFYGQLGARGRAIVDVFGGLVLLLPSMLVILWVTWPFVHRSWIFLEGPMSVGGIPASFLLKSLIPAFCVLLSLQGISLILSSLRPLFDPPAAGMIGDFFVEYLDIVMFLVLCAAILLGFPVVFTLTGIAVLFAGLGWLLGVFDLPLLGALGQRIFGIMTSNVLVAIPLFIFMGIVLERSRIAEDLLETMGRLFGTLRGGLAISVVLVGALLAASTGIVGATVVTMGLIALPSMLRHGYDRKLASGTVVTAGTLGQIIPPSTMLIILSEVMSTAYQQAQFRQGLFTVETISVGQVFAAALMPGLMLVGVYLVYVVMRAVFSPAAAPALKAEEAGHVGALNVLRMLVPPIVLIIAVLGSILGGLATPTEGAAVGAIGAILLAGFRLADGRSSTFLGLCVAALVAVIALATVTTLRPQRATAGAVELGLAGLAVVLCALAAAGIAIAVWRLRRAGVLRDIAVRTMTISAMIFGTIIGASVFSLVFRGLGGDRHIETLITAMPGGPDGALFFVMALIFVVGFFLDFVEISVIILPIVAPALILLGVDPIWLAVLIAINLQTSFLTPPFGFSLFYLRGAAPAEITTWDIYRGVAPYIGLQIVGLFLVWAMPVVATALPRALFG